MAYLYCERQGVRMEITFFNDKHSFKQDIYSDDIIVNLQNTVIKLGILGLLLPFQHLCIIYIPDINMACCQKYLSFMVMQGIPCFQAGVLRMMIEIIYLR